MELNPYAPPTVALEGAPAAAADLNPSTPLFFPVSLTKLALLYFASFGLYQLHWFVENWQLIREREGGISPIARALLSVFFCFSLFKRIQDETKCRSLRMAGGAGVLALGWIALTLACRLPNPGWIITFLSVLPLLVVQKTVNEINQQAVPDHDPNARITPGNIVVMMIGLPVLFVVVFGLQ